MFNVKEKDINTWNMFEKGSISVNKSEVPFSAIGADHALEQVNGTVKVIGGIKSIGNNENVLSYYILIAAEIGNIVKSFSTNFDLDGKESRKKKGTLSTGGREKYPFNRNR